MQKHIVWMLVLCLAGLTCTGIAGAEGAEQRMELHDPIIEYDGTILQVMVEVTTPSEEIALVETDLLNPGLENEPEVQEALAAGGTLMGVYVDVELFSGDTKLEDLRVFISGHGGRMMSKGFIYVLTPESPREDLSVHVKAMLQETVGGPALEQAEVRSSVPEPVQAETVTIPADISLLDILPNNMWLIMDEEAPDRSWLGGAFISSSENAFCLMLFFDGDAEYEIALLNPEDTEPYPYRFSLNNSWPPRDAEWAVYVFDPVPQMPEKLSVTLNHPSLSHETATIEIDLAAKTVTLV